MGYYVAFGLLSAIGGLVFFILLYNSTTWNPYAVWLAAWSGITLIIYILDKILSKVRGPRVPELVLHLLAAIGGFGGAWLGMLVAQHKKNIRKHPIIWVVLTLSTLGHAALIYTWLIKG